MTNQVIRNGVELKPSQLESIKRRFHNKVQDALIAGRDVQVEYKQGCDGKSVVVEAREFINGTWFTMDKCLIGPKGKIV